MDNFSDKVVLFNETVGFNEPLPAGIKIMNPFKENEQILPVMRSFYHKYYSDKKQRKFIIGINPGRLGAGATGIPFTDTKRLDEICQIKIDTFQTHEPSSVFIYDVLNAYGGAQQFYGDFYINSMCPLGFILKNARSNWVNCNYYDFAELYKTVKPFIVECLKAQIDFGINTERCYILGKKNATFFKAINDEFQLFNHFSVLDHPRFIVQYKSKQKEQYVLKYLKLLSE